MEVRHLYAAAREARLKISQRVTRRPDSARGHTERVSQVHYRIAKWNDLQDDPIYRRLRVI